MKNVYKVTGFIALIAIAGLLCAACNLFGGNIPVKVRAYDNKGNDPGANLSMVRASVRGNGGPLLAVTETGNTERIEAAYNEKLGEPLVAYTPTQFTINYLIDAVLSDGTLTHVAPIQQYDFTKGLTVEVGDVPPGITVSALRFHTSVYATDTGPVKNTAVIQTDDGPVTLDIDELRGIFAREGDESVFYSMESFICYGDTRKFTDPGDMVPGPGGTNLNPSGLATMVFPFEPKVISSGTSSVTLTISWDLTGIIGDYYDEELSNPNVEMAGDGSYRYRLSKGWWDSVYIYANVE